ncbi:MAG: GntR family transcriptional regulator [Micromonosporaceae bacterium]
MLDSGAVGVSKTHRVANSLRARITSGDLAPGDAIPPESELEREFGYNRTTIRRAISILQGEGLIDVVHGRGTFVRQRRLIRRDPIAGLRYEHQRASGDGSDTGLFEAVTGTRGTVKVDHSYSNAEARADLAEAFQVEEGTPLLRRTYYYLVDGAPHQIVESYLLAEMVAGTAIADPANERPGRGTMAQLRDLSVYVERCTLGIQTRMPSPHETEALTIGPGTPVMVHRRVMFAEDRVVEVGEIVVPGDRLLLTLEVDLRSDS